jgi:hypothetical protein
MGKQESRLNLQLLSLLMKFQGEKSVGKSFALNHLFDTSFAGMSFTMSHSVSLVYAWFRVRDANH